jgi:hypothetical protein
LRELNKATITARTKAAANKKAAVTNSPLASSKSIPKPCYKQYTSIFKIDAEMTCYVFVTGDSCVIVV